MSEKEGFIRFSCHIWTLPPGRSIHWIPTKGLNDSVDRN
jgi:hypothetical protein